MEGPGVPIPLGRSIGTIRTTPRLAVSLSLTPAPTPFVAGPLGPQGPSVEERSSPRKTLLLRNVKRQEIIPKTPEFKLLGLSTEGGLDVPEKPRRGRSSLPTNSRSRGEGPADRPPPTSTLPVPGPTPPPTVESRGGNRRERLGWGLETPVDVTVRPRAPRTRF